MRAALRILHRRVVAPLRAGDVPTGQLSRGAGIGLGFALFPIVGQLYLTPVLWAALRPLLPLRFNLPVAMGMVLIVNPPVKVPLFYLYLLSGEALLSLAGMTAQTGAHDFKAAWDAAAEGAWIGRFSAIGRLLTLALERYALPLGIGGTVWAVLLGLFAWAGTAFYLARARNRH